MIRYAQYLVLLCVLSFSLAVEATSVNPFESRAEDVGRYTAVGIASDGLPVVGYHDETEGDLVYAKCTNSRCSSALIRKIDSVDDVGEFLSMAMAPSGNAVLSYRYDGSSYGMSLAICNDLECTAPVIQDFPTGHDLLDTAVAISNDGLPVVAYSVDQEGLRVTKCTAASCAPAGSAVSTFVVPNVPNDFTSVSIAIGNDGNPLISYVWDDDLWLVKCSTTACTAAGTPQQVIKDGGEVRNATMLVRGATKDPIIAYRFDATDNAQDGLYLIECDDPLCQGDNTADENVGLVLGGTSFGRNLSMTLGSDGAPVIAHRTNGSNDLLVTKCLMPDCKPDPSDARIAILPAVDTSGDVGEYTSIAISPNLNQPIIFYYDATNSDPKVAIIGNDRPAILPIADLTVTEGSGGELQFYIPVEDLDNAPADTFTYTLQPVAGFAFPPNLSNPGPDGLFSWDVGSDEHTVPTYGVKIIVNDGTSQNNRNFFIDIIETNSKPVISYIQNRSTNIGKRLRFPIVVNDVDVPVNILTYALTANFPETDPKAALVQDDNGDYFFDWTPQKAGIYSFGLSVTDNGSPQMTARTYFNVIVGRELLVNGGFEAPTTNLTAPPAKWSRSSLTSDVRKCTSGFANKGKCAFLFVGGTNENSQLIQTVASSKLPAIKVNDGLIISAAVRPQSAVAGQIIEVTVIYGDGTPEKILLNMPPTLTSTTYIGVDNTAAPLIVSSAHTSQGVIIKKITVAIQYTGTTGRYRIDDISLVSTPTLSGRTLEGADAPFIPLPPQP